MNEGMGWKAKSAIILAIMLVGAALAVWGLARWQGAAQFFGVAPSSAQAEAVAAPAPPSDDDPPLPVQQAIADGAPAQSEGLALVNGEVGSLEERIARLEMNLNRAEGSAGRADALLVAFAARRAVERGVALGYLEPLLVARFGGAHEAEVATIITASRNPVQLDALIEEYQQLGQDLRRGDPAESTWSAFKRELGNIVSVYPADQPSPRPQARYERALVQLRLGDVDAALTETLRLPGIAAAQDWIDKANRYVAAQRALDRIESAALLSRGENETN
ncbi:hypothetical protein [Sphingomicrobium flavum]|uniref:hypothetical protein n=1 Tax=Sphingomicrobium flavum TaxID=1229164 RepID=UPI0021ADE599|nr:hypothetical protein [Sphingomicrobium flavum]